MTLSEAVSAVKKGETIRTSGDGFKIFGQFSVSDKPEMVDLFGDGKLFEQAPNTVHHSNFKAPRMYLGMDNGYAIVPTGRVIVEDGQEPERACFVNQVYAWE